MNTSETTETIIEGKREKKQEELIKMKEYIIEKFNSKDGLNYFGSNQNSKMQFLAAKLGEKYVRRQREAYDHKLISIYGQEYDRRLNETLADGFKAEKLDAEQPQMSTQQEQILIKFLKERELNMLRLSPDNYRYADNTTRNTGMKIES